MTRKADFELDSKDFRAGTYRVTDVSNDPSWDDVKCVEAHSVDGELVSVSNHRDKDFATVCERLMALGAIAKATQA